jgi:transcriptional regulator with XRE-family HTH domain
MPIGERILRRRKKLGLSQRTLAALVHVPQPVISNLERGRRDEITTSLLKRFAQALGCTTDYLVGMDEGTESWAALAS